MLSSLNAIQVSFFEANKRIFLDLSQFFGPVYVFIANTLRHESGLSWLDHTFKNDDFLLENLKKNIVGQVFEKEPPHFPGWGGIDNTPTNREYHTITRGCILNEIVRRTDPQNRTIGEIIKQVSKYV